MSYARAAVQAVFGHQVHLAGSTLVVPGSMAIRLSTVLGNRRIHKLLDPFLRDGRTVVDVGANIGLNTIYFAARVGPTGRVIAVEPAGDNLAVLRDNVARNRLAQVTVADVAAGRARETRSFYLRGDVSAVNSFYEDSVYASVTDLVVVPVVPLDELVEGEAHVVKVDVEGAELDVLAGMTRLLGSRSLVLVVEWHPLLQEKAGFAPDALPDALFNRGFNVTSASHTGTTRLARRDVPRLIDRLRRSGRPVDLLATR